MALLPTLSPECPRDPVMPPLKNGSLALTGLSNRPTLHEEPVKLSLSGEIEGAQSLRQVRKRVIPDRIEAGTFMASSVPLHNPDLENEGWRIE